MSQTTKNPISVANINWSDQKEPFSTDFNDVYFNTDNGLQESIYNFLEGNNLTERWENHKSRIFSIAETGFGTGLNFLLTCDAFQTHLNLNPNSTLKHLFFTSFEKYPLSKQDLIIALEQWPKLASVSANLIAQYPINLTGCHRIHLDELNITLDLWFGDAADSLSNLHVYESGLFDAWYLDGFSPNKNPDMWQQGLFDLIVHTSKEGATLATFAAASFVRKGLQSAGVIIKKRKGFGKKREMLTGIIPFKKNAAGHKQFIRHCATIKSHNIAIIGGGLSGACLALALVKRDFHVTIYCKDKQLAQGASGNRQGALYPLINETHNELSQFFANAFLYARNVIQSSEMKDTIDYDFSGLLQLYYDQPASKKLNKILSADLPTALVRKLDIDNTNSKAGICLDLPSLFYSLAGWVNPEKMVYSLLEKASKSGKVNIKLNCKIERIEQINEQSNLHIKTDENHPTVVAHDIVILASGMSTLGFSQCKAIPLSSARGQVTYVRSKKSNDLNKLKLPLCHEGYLTPQMDNIHCMGATFDRHNENEAYQQQDQSLNKAKLNKCIPNKNWIKEIDCNHQFANVGIRATTRDHFPYMGQLADYETTKSSNKNAHIKDAEINAPFYKNIFILSGLGSRGICSAPLLAETLASQISKEPLPLSGSILNSLQTNRQWINYLLKNKPLKH